MTELLALRNETVSLLDGMGPTEDAGEAGKAG